MASAQPWLAPTRASAAPPSPRSRGSASPSLSASAAPSSEEEGSSSGLRVPAAPTRRSERDLTAGGRGGQGRCQTPGTTLRKANSPQGVSILAKGDFSKSHGCRRSGGQSRWQRHPASSDSQGLASHGDGGGCSGSRNKAAGRHHTPLSGTVPDAARGQRGGARVCGPRLCP